MKISALVEDIVTAVYEHNGQELTLQINRNVVTAKYLHEIAAHAKPVNPNGSKALPQAAPIKADTALDLSAVYEETALLFEQQTALAVTCLTNGLLKGWDLTEDDETTPVPITKESLERLPPILIQDIWSFAMEQAQGVKKTKSEAGSMISDVTATGSLEPPSAENTADQSM